MENAGICMSRQVYAGIRRNIHFSSKRSGGRGMASELYLLVSRQLNIFDRSAPLCVLRTYVPSPRGDLLQ